MYEVEWSGKLMVFCNHTKNVRYKNEINQWKDGYSKFLISKNSWKYSFENEYSRKDCEQSILSQMIFINLFMKTCGSCEADMYSGGKSINININGLEKQFLFDVMNNPNKGNQPYTQAKYCDYKSMKFKELYHTIGNFAPVPKTIVSRYYGPNLQLIHRDLNELWPWFLKFLQDNWEFFPTKVYEVMSFREYMRYTCQEMYYANIFNESYTKYQNNSTWESIINDISDNKFLENDTLISFNDLFEKKDIEEIDNRISFLIELRGRYIIYCLNKYR